MAGDLAWLADVVRRDGPEPAPAQLCAVKGRALMQAKGVESMKERGRARAHAAARGLHHASGDTAGAMATRHNAGGTNAAKSQYAGVGGKEKCNAGRGNGSKGCEPGNSGDNQRSPVRYNRNRVSPLGRCLLERRPRPPRHVTCCDHLLIHRRSASPFAQRDRTGLDRLCPLARSRGRAELARVESARPSTMAVGGQRLAGARAGPTGAAGGALPGPPFG